MKYNLTVEYSTHEGGLPTLKINDTTAGIVQAVECLYEMFAELESDIGLEVKPKPKKKYKNGG